MSEVAIIGAGPYGLSVAAQLKARGIEYRIFGKPLDTWRDHMPKQMMLKSDGFASNLSSPVAGSTMKAWCEKQGLDYADQGLPISLKQFVTYADAFRGRFVPEVEERMVTALEQTTEGFVLTLEDGERVAARHVVMAVGVTWFTHLPRVLRGFSTEYVTHSYDHREVEQYRGRDVAVIGAGSSAVDLAWALHEAGAKAHIVARKTHVEFNRVPDPSDEMFFNRVLRPASGIGRGWKSVFCASAPLMFYRLPEALRARAVQSHMHPAAGWFMREKVEGAISMSLGQPLTHADLRDGRVTLTLGENSDAKTLSFDHVMAATGYVTDMRRVPFLSPSLCAGVAPQGAMPAVSDTFETAIPNLFVVGVAAMDSFGPLLRFMVGAEFAAPRAANAIERKVAEPARRRAA